MSMFQLSEHINKSKVFLVNKSQIEKRFDPFYYVPELMALEEKVWQKNPHKLIHYAKAVSSGATPKTTESEKYYTDKENGIPFLRVQNLSPTGQLSFDNLKYINEETHNGILARSKVKGGNLLIKITGVGRMAVSSVAPENFEANANQHMVVMKTYSPETSKILAAYLNSDIGEKLASRRATGGTRPALDYPALLSIPVIYDKRILEITATAVKKKEAKEQQAKDLLASIDEYMLKKLGIILPEQENDLANRMFNVQFSNVTSHRFDPYFSQPHFVKFFDILYNTNYDTKKLSKISTKITSGATPKAGGIDYTDSTEGIPFLRSGNITDSGLIDFDELLYIKPHIHNGLLRSSQVQKSDLLIAIVGATIGQVGMYLYDKEANINQAIALVRLSNGHNIAYVMEYMRSSIGQYILNRLKRPVARANINLDEIGSIPVVLPQSEKQNEIADHIRQLREQAKQLQQEAEKELKKASREVEALILGNSNEIK